VEKGILMNIRMMKEIDNIKKQLLIIGATVEESVRLATRSVVEHKPEWAQQVVDGDEVIDQMEVELEEECLKVLALHQPVAGDLRFLIAVLKINNDLERIGDLSVNIAQSAQELCCADRMESPFDLPRMAELTQAMLRHSLDALVNGNLELAYQVSRDDDAVDELHREMYQSVKVKIVQMPDKVSLLLHFLRVSRMIERIADHAANIAEDVVYLIEGEIKRHRMREGEPKS